MSTKIFLHRKSATAALRKIGITADQYDQRIKKVTNGFQVELSESPSTSNKVRVVNKVNDKAAAPKEPSQAQRIREMIKAGRTNLEITKLLNLPEKQQSYPGWYRNQLARQAEQRS